MGASNPARMMAALAACAAAILGTGLGAEPPGGKKLLCGFEIAEMKPADSRRYRYWAGKAWTGKKEPPPGWRFTKNKDFHVSAGYKGDVTVYRSGSSRDYPICTLAYSTDSQGRHALRRRFAGKWEMNRWGRLLPKPHVTEPLRRGPNQLRGIPMFNSFGKFKRMFPRDWSGYARLLVDVRSTSAAASFSILLEDDDCEPYLDRIYKLPAGKWVTVVFDLADAKKQKMLDPAKMAGIMLAVEKVEGATEIQLDNLRLAPASGRSKFEFVEDKRPWRKPFLDAEPAEPVPVKIAAKPDHSPIKLEKPAIIEGLHTRMSYTRFSQLHHSLSAFDNRYMVLGGNLGGGKSALVSRDGGRTWTGIDGDRKATYLSSGAQGDRGVYLDDNCGLLGVTITTCAGGSKRSDLYFRALSFTGAKWERSGFHLVDVDVRHCPAQTTVLREQNGRIWAAWDHLNRHGTTVVRLKCSDDGGRTWRRPSESGFLDNQRTILGGGPVLAPYGEKGVAIFWRNPNYHLMWARTDDGKTWTKPTIALKKSAIKAAVRVSDKALYFSNAPGPRTRLVFIPAASAVVMRWDGKQWSEEPGPWKKAAGKIASPNLSVTGKRLCAAWCERGSKGDRVMMALRKANGSWSKPFEAACGEGQIENLVVPRISPPNFVPLAWSPKHHKWVKVLRVPVEKLGK